MKCNVKLAHQKMFCYFVVYQVIFVYLVYCLWTVVKFR